MSEDGLHFLCHMPFYYTPLVKHLICGLPESNRALLYHKRTVLYVPRCKPLCKHSSAVSGCVGCLNYAGAELGSTTHHKMGLIGKQQAQGSSAQGNRADATGQGATITCKRADITGQGATVTSQRADMIGQRASITGQRAWSKTHLLITFFIRWRSHEDAIFGGQPHIQVPKSLVQSGLVAAAEDHHSCVGLVAEGGNAVVHGGVDPCHCLRTPMLLLITIIIITHSSSCSVCMAQALSVIMLLLSSHCHYDAKQAC